MADSNIPSFPNDSDNGKHSKDLQKIEEQLVKSNPAIFKNVPKQVREKLIQTVVSYTATMRVRHQGPLPPAEDLEKYASVIPDGGNRIMAMAENQQRHRMELENFAIREQMKQSGRGQIFGLVVALVAIGGGIACALMGHEWAGSIIGAGGLTGLVSIFVLGKDRQKKSLEEKAPPQTEGKSSK